MLLLATIDKTSITVMNMDVLIQQMFERNSKTSNGFCC